MKCHHFWQVGRNFWIHVTLIFIFKQQWCPNPFLRFKVDFQVNVPLARRRRRNIRTNYVSGLARISFQNTWAHSAPFKLGPHPDPPFFHHLKENERFKGFDKNSQFNVFDRWVFGWIFRASSQHRHSEPAHDCQTWFSRSVPLKKLTRTWESEADEIYWNIIKFIQIQDMKAKVGEVFWSKIHLNILIRKNFQVASGNWWPNIHPGNEAQNRQSLSPKKGKFHVPTSQASKFQGALLAVSFRVSVIDIWCICQLSLKFLRGTLHRTSLEPQPENAVKRGEHRKAPMPRTMAAGTPAVEAPVEAPGEEGWEGLQMPDRIYGTWILRVCTCSQVQWRCLIYKFYNRFLARKPWVEVMRTWMMNLMKLFHSYLLFTWIFGFLALRNSHSGLGKFHYNSNDSSFSCGDLDLHLLHHKLRTSSQRPPDRSDGQTKHISRLSTQHQWAVVSCRATSWAVRKKLIDQHLMFIFRKPHLKMGQWKIQVSSIS